MMETYDAYIVIDWGKHLIYSVDGTWYLGSRYVGDTITLPMEKLKEEGEIL